MVYTMKIYVDGGCRRNGHPNAIGAAAACIQHRSGNFNCWTRNVCEGPDGEAPTSQRAEISAIILALELALNKYQELDGDPYMDVEIFSDSRYAVNCMTDWVYKWESNGWTNSRGQPVVNQDLIRRASRLDDEVDQLGKVTYTWIPRESNRVADEKCNDCLDEQEDDTMSTDGYSSDEYW